MARFTVDPARLNFNIERKGKEYNLRVLQRAQSIFSTLLSLLPSNYTSTISGPNYTLELKAVAVEVAKIELALEDVSLDLDYTRTRSEFLYGAIGYLCFLNNRLPSLEFNDSEFRQFLLNLIRIYFQGSVPKSIKDAVGLFLTSEFQILENFLLVREGSAGLDISDQFGFQIDVATGNQFPSEIFDLQSSIRIILDIIRPAHTLFSVRFIFEDDYDPNPPGGGGGGTDTFGRIADSMRWALSNYYYEDYRRYWSGLRDRDRLGVKECHSVVGETHGTVNVVAHGVSRFAFTSSGDMEGLYTAIGTTSQTFVASGVLTASESPFHRGTLKLPSLLLEGSLAPVVDLIGTPTLPSLQLSGGVTPQVEAGGALTLPSLMLSGTIGVFPYTVAAFSSGLWWDPEEGVSNLGATNFRWAERNGVTSHDQVQATVSKQPLPIVTSNGKTAWRYDSAAGAASFTRSAIAAEKGFTGAQMVCGWFRFPDGAPTTILDYLRHFGSSGAQGFVCRQADANTMWAHHSETGSDSIRNDWTYTPDSEWHFLEWVYDPSLSGMDRLKFYVDRVLLATLTTSNVPGASAFDPVNTIDVGTTSPSVVVDRGTFAWTNGIPSDAERDEFKDYGAPVFELTGALALPSLQLAGSLSPAVDLIGALTLPSLLLEGSINFEPDELSAVSSWLRVDGATVTGSGVSSLPDALNVNPAVQATDARRPTKGTSANGLPILTFDGADFLVWPLIAANNDVDTTGFAFWFRSAAVGINRYLFGITLYASGASGHKLELQLAGDDVLNLIAWFSDANGRIGGRSAPFTLNTWHFITCEYDKNWATEAQRQVISIDGVVQTLTFGSSGAGGSGPLQTVTDNMIIGARGQSGAFYRPLRPGDAIGPNILALGSRMAGATEGLLTAAARADLMSFEAPTEVAPLTGDLTLPSQQMAGSLTPTVDLTGALALPSLLLDGSLTPAVDFTGDLTLPSQQMAGSLTPTVDLTGALALPSQQMAGSLTPAVDLTGTLTLPSQQMAGSLSPTVDLTGDLTLPSQQMAGSVSPAVDLTGPLTLPSQQLSGEMYFDPSGSSAVSSWLRVEGATVTGSGVSLLPDVLSANPATQVTDARRPALETIGNGQPPILVFDGADVLAWPLTAGNNNRAALGFGFWYRPVVVTAVNRMALAAIVYNGGSTASMLQFEQLADAFKLAVYFTNANGRVGTTPAVLSALVWHFVTVEYESTAALEANRQVVSVDGVVVSLTFASVGAGGSGLLQAVSGNVLIGAQGVEGGSSLYVPAGTQMGPHFYAFNAKMAGTTQGLLTTTARTNLMNFERPFEPSRITSLVAHWSGNGSTAASAPNRIIGSSVGALVQATTADQPAVVTLANGVQVLSFDGVSEDTSTTDVAALRFAGATGYWAWHLRSLDTVLNSTRYLVSQWADGGTAERFNVAIVPTAGTITVNVAISTSSFSAFTFAGTLPSLQAGCWMEILFDGNQSIANSGEARCLLFLDGVSIPRKSVSGTMPATLQPGDSSSYWVAGQNGSVNKLVDIAHHYVANDIPSAMQRSLLQLYEAPVWNTPNLYPQPVLCGVGTTAGSTSSASTNWPSHIIDDVALLCVETANEPVTTPAGWTAVTNGSQGVGTPGSITATRLQVFWRRAASHSEASVAVVSQGDHVITGIVTFRGCLSTGDPINVSAGNATSDADTTAVSIPGATTTVANCLVVAIASRQTVGAATEQSGEVNASLSSLTEVRDSFNSSGNGGGYAVVSGVKATAGAYSATTATLANASRQGRVSLALKPIT